MGSASDNICVIGNTVCLMAVRGPVRTLGEGGRGMELGEKANGRFPHGTALGDQTGPLFCSAPEPSRALSPERGTQEALDSAESHTPLPPGHRSTLWHKLHYRDGSNQQSTQARSWEPFPSRSEWEGERHLHKVEDMSLTCRVPQGDSLSFLRPLFALL